MMIIFSTLGANGLKNKRPDGSLVKKLQAAAPGSVVPCAKLENNFKKN